MKNRLLPAAGALLLTVPAPGDWLQFRGPGGAGIAEPAAGPGADLTVAWEQPLPGQGLSAPVVVGDRVFVTCSSGPQEESLHVLCLNASTGEKIWERVLKATGRTMCHEKTAVAAPTPCSDGRRLYALFSSNDLLCFDLEGNLQWLRGLTVDFPNASNSLGMASSPVVLGDTLVVPSENDSESLVLGVDAATGRTRWKMERPKMANWTSPVTAGEWVGLQSGRGVTAVAPSTGSILWETEGGAATIPSSAIADGVLYVPSRGMTALRVRAEGPPEELWNSPQLNPATASPLAFEGRVFVINSAGVLVAASAETGENEWKLRLSGPFSGSPVAAPPHLYIASEKGVLQAVDTSVPEGKVSAELNLGQPVLSTPALSGGALFIRSDSRLWRVE